jgi:hypothetical protein
MPVRISSNPLPGLVPGTHVFNAAKGVDALGSNPWAEGPRDKPGQGEMVRMKWLDLNGDYSRA